ncbi:MAG: hypothetical protein NTY98_01155, partial [Verrucomicrobia bacterium]|nr:hypothetical protein [Verrucomicrobiota bacterium]
MPSRSFTQFMLLALALCTLPCSLRAQEFPSATGAGTLVDRLEAPRAQKFSEEAASSQKPEADKA